MENRESLKVETYGTPIDQAKTVWFWQPGLLLGPPEAATADRIARELRACILSVDREALGEGNSFDMIVERTRKFLQEHGIEKCGGIGVSIGATYTLRVAQDLHTQFETILLFNPLPPPECGTLQEIPSEYSKLFMLAKLPPFIAKFLIKRYKRKSPDFQDVDSYMGSLYTEDRKFIEGDHDVSEVIREMVSRLLTDETKFDAVVREMRDFISNTGIDLSKIQQDVTIAQGSNDRTTPLKLARKLASKLHIRRKNKRRIHERSGGHYNFFKTIHEFLPAANKLLLGRETA